MVIRALDKNFSLPKVSMLDSMNIFVSSWNVVSTEAIVNCLRRAETGSSSQDLTKTDSEDPFKELNEEFLRLRRINLTKYELSADKYLGLDGNECTTKEHLIIYKEILSSLLPKVDDGKNDNNFVEENEVPTIKLLSSRRRRGRK